MRIISPAVRVKRSAAGRVGGLQTFLRHGREGMSARGRLGGRPRLGTLAEIEIQSSSHQENIERGKRLTGLKRLPVNGPDFSANRELSILNKKEGELVASAPPGSPEGVPIEFQNGGESRRGIRED